MKNKKIIGLTAMSLVLGSTIATADARSQIATRPAVPAGISQEDFQAEKEAIESGNYSSWKSIVEKQGNVKILETVNESNFAKYAEAFKLRESGDMEGSRAIMEELGLKDPGEKGGDGAHGMPVSKETRDAIESAIKNADYDAWKVAVESLQQQDKAESVTEDQFNILVEAYKLKESGDMDSAMKLLRDNNIPGGMFLGGERGRGGDEIPGVDREALMETYQNKDYSAWKTLMGERGGKILEIINEDNFSKFAEAKVLQSEGKGEEARTIFKELGLPFQDRGQKPEKPADISVDADLSSNTD